ncbi:MAG TPA: cobalamin biosynthesis protein CobD [Methanophagales archaeon]|nr:cobalamin biosynthesis protein CobD [Methanophagales archaeon]
MKTPIGNNQVAILYSLFGICLVLLCYILFWDFMSTLQIQKLLIDQIVIFAVAILIDLIIGDPPEKIERYYPIVWISRLMYLFDGITRRGDARREKILGVVYALLTISIFSVPCLMLPCLSELVYIVLGSLIFKMTFTVKGLERFGRKALQADNLDAKRAAVGKMVSRNVSVLDDEHLNSATIESIAENLTDSVIAPFFYFILFGVFGAMVYRVINTLDAVVGYKTRRYIHFGWFSAKADDVLNYLPERIAAGLIILVSNAKLKDVWKNVNEIEGVHLTIIAMSYALKVKLEKIGYYAVGDKEGFGVASVEHIARAIRIVKRSTITFAFVCILVMVIFYFLFAIP